MNKKEMICYNIDASRLTGKAEKVVFPENIEQVQNIVKTANLDVVPRGAGTRLLGGTIPDKSIVVDMSKMNKIIDFDKKKDIVYTEAGISIKELNEKLNALGFEFPIQSINKASTIGGMIAINLSNARSLRYGKIKDWIEEIEFVNGRGELMKTSKADLADVCGMEGITGIIVNVKLKTSPIVERSISIFQTNSLDEVLSISRRLKLEKDIVMLEVFPEKASEMLGLPRKYNLIVEFDSQRGKIKGKEYEKILDLKKKIYYVLDTKEYFNIEDTKLFFDKIKEFVLYLETNQIPYFAYLGSGIIYSFFRDDEMDKRKEMISYMRRMGGKFVTGIGIKRKRFVDDFEKKILQRVKLRHDPFGKLNKGKIIDFEAKISTGKHLKPLQEDEIDAIKPFIKEKEIVEPEKQEKSAEEKMGEFIEKVEILEGEITPKEDKEALSETQILLKDYEQTYESELPEKRRKIVEKFAKNIGKEITDSKEEEEFKIDDPNVELRGKLTDEEQEEVNEIMFGGRKEDENQ